MGAQSQEEGAPNRDIIIVLFFQIRNGNTSDKNQLVNQNWSKLIFSLSLEALNVAI